MKTAKWLLIVFGLLAAGVLLAIGGAGCLVIRALYHVQFK